MFKKVVLCALIVTSCQETKTKVVKEPVPCNKIKIHVIGYYPEIDCSLIAEKTPSGYSLFELCGNVKTPGEGVYQENQNCVKAQFNSRNVILTTCMGINSDFKNLLSDEKQYIEVCDYLSTE